MIDIHTHILPGLDDGAPDMETALEMAAIAAESGVQILVATPHSAMDGQQVNLWGPRLTQALLDFRQAVEQAGIPLVICPGMEIFGTPEVPDLLYRQQLMPLNGTRYPLVEFPFANYAGQATDILGQLRARRMTPVVAHPERYLYVQKDPTLLNIWVEMGCLLQVNRGSLMGRFGRAEEQLALELVERKFAFVVASDAHSPASRTPWLKDVQTLLTEEFSPDAAKMLLETNPRRILKNEIIQWGLPDWF